MNKWVMWGGCSAVVFGAFLTILGSGELSTLSNPLFVLVLFVAAVAAGGLGTLIHGMVVGATHTLLAGGEGQHRHVPPLSKARAMIRAEEWDGAREELEHLWKEYPGDGDLVREFEHLYEHLGASEGLAQFLVKAVPSLRGDDKAYVYWRLVETYSEVLKRDNEAMPWCRRLLAEFPASTQANLGRSFLKQHDDRVKNEVPPR